MSKKIALNIGIGASVNGSLGKSFDQAQRESEELGKSYEKVNRQLARAQTVSKYERQLARVNKRMQDGKGDTLALQKVQSKLEKELKQSQRAAKNAGVDIRNLAREEHTLAWKAKQAEKQQALLNHELKKTQRIEKLRAATTGRAMNYGRESMVGRGVSALGGGAGLAGGMGLAAAGVGAVATAGVAVGAAGFAATVRMAEQLDVIGKRADQLDVTTNALQELQYAADRTGMGGEEMIDALQDQAEKISEAAMLGTGEAVDVLAALNLNAAELNKLSPDQQIMKVADAMEQVENQNDKQQLAIKLWGGSAAKMVNTIKGGSKALQELRDNARPIDEKVIRDSEAFNDALLDMKKAGMGAFATMMAPAVPWLTRQIQNLTAWLDENRDELAAFADGAGQVFSTLFRLGRLIYQIVAPGFKLIGAVVKPVLSMLGSLIEMLVSAGEKVVAFRDSAFGGALGTISSFFSDNEPAESVAAQPSSLPQMKPAGGNNYSSENNYSMVIHQQPGEDSQQLSQRIAAEMDRREHEKQRRMRGGLYDMAPA